MIKLKRGTFQHVESELYNYHETKREIVRIKNEILHGRFNDGDDNVGGGKGNLPGDPTGRTATLLVTHKRLEQIENIVQAIENVVLGLPDDKRGLVQRRYWTKPQTLTWDGIAQEMNVGRRTAIRWRDQIVVTIAKQIGWG